MTTLEYQNSPSIFRKVTLNIKIFVQRHPLTLNLSKSRSLPKSFFRFPDTALQTGQNFREDQSTTLSQATLSLSRQQCYDFFLKIHPTISWIYIVPGLLLTPFPEGDSG